MKPLNWTLGSLAIFLGLVGSACCCPSGDYDDSDGYEEQKTSKRNSKNKMSDGQLCAYSKIRPNAEGMADFIRTERTEHADDIIAEMVKLGGLGKAPDVYEGPTANAEAWLPPYTCGDESYPRTCEPAVPSGERVIIYNPDWLRDYRDKTGTNWAIVFVLAHELGHHLNGHVGGYSGSKQQDLELEADYYAGFVMGKLGASKREAKAAPSALSAARSSSHPGRDERVSETLRGWEDARASQ